MKMQIQNKFPQWKRKCPDAEAQIPKQGEVDIWPQKIFENKKTSLKRDTLLGAKGKKENEQIY